MAKGYFIAGDFYENKYTYFFRYIRLDFVYGVAFSDKIVIHPNFRFGFATYLYPLEDRNL